jgi:hypothetical protein
MANAKTPSPDTIARTARELVGTFVDEQDLEAVAALLGALAVEMAPMRAMEIGGAEPATAYDASEP